MLRACLTIFGITLLSVGLAQLRDAQGLRPVTADSKPVFWVRTVDGWEPSRVLSVGPPPPDPPTLHPALVATLQVGVSVFALLAMPGGQSIVRKS